MSELTDSLFAEMPSIKGMRGQLVNRNTWRQVYLGVSWSYYH